MTLAEVQFESVSGNIIKVWESENLAIRWRHVFALSIFQVATIYSRGCTAAIFVGDV
jgi:hypothetical protein